MSFQQQSSTKLTNGRAEYLNFRAHLSESIDVLGIPSLWDSKGNLNYLSATTKDRICME